MILRSPAENENGGTSLRTFSPPLVIPAHAGIQVCFPAQLAWIPACAGMTERCGYFSYSGSSFYRSSTHRYFRRSVSCPGAHLERMKMREECGKKRPVAQRRDRPVSGAQEPAKECDPGPPSAPQNVASLSADESTRRRIELAGSPLGAPKERGSVDE
jgi:hypothetical protein